ncbi:vitamin K-dependent gamma-carboxylase [Leptidea sinapis]|uniref:vitamin K-dependent gamma-carboxylase n=1 Tax=Leptidea sinapis TaxID=189913 RepID=UPI0021C3001E|nr:vitamin K-dependent gamma-carboxylase [Leptidea sinapis]
MLFDIPDERGGADMTSRWGNTNNCHFPLLPFITVISMPYMALVYLGLWFGGMGIALGYQYRYTSWLFTLCYWYIILIEKSFWNNHSYLFGLVALLLACTQANCLWSLDVYFNPSLKKNTVPYWNYFILKYQFFTLYFMAGLKKGTAEWLTGYSVPKLSAHWVFTPFHLFLSIPQIDYIIVHWFVFMFDLTIAFWMMWAKSRNTAMVFCALFHLMNSRLFKIGMFPWVCLATMPLFYPFDWPRRIQLGFSNALSYLSFVKWCFISNMNVPKCEENVKCIRSAVNNDETTKDENDLQEPEEDMAGDVFCHEKDNEENSSQVEPDVQQPEVENQSMKTFILILLDLTIGRMDCMATPGI